MPVPSPVTFTPFVDLYGMLSIKDIAVADWGSGGKQEGGSLVNLPIVPIRTPMFQSRIDPAEKATDAAEAGQRARQTGKGISVSFEAPAPANRQDAPLERGADLTRTWALFFEELRKRLLQLGGTAIQTGRRLHAVLCWVDETETTDVFAIIGAVDATTDPLVIAAPTLSTPRTEIPPYAEPWSVGDYVVWNDPSQSGVDAAKRRYECGQVTGYDTATGEVTIRRHWPESQPGNRATFESYMEAHGAVRLYRVHTSLFTYDLKENAYVIDSAGGYSGLPRRWDITLPHAAVVAVYMAAENESGIGPWTGVNTSYPYTDEDVTQLPPAPGLRTHVGASYWFEEPGDIVARDRPDGLGGTISTLNFYPTLPIRIQDWASLRTMYGFVGKPAKEPAASVPLKLRMKILYAADRVDGKELYDPVQPWEDLEDLLWQKNLAGDADICSADEGAIEGVTWGASQENPPTQRRMPYCEDQLFWWDPEGVLKAWPTPVMEADAWLTFDVLVAELGDDSLPPADLTVVIQT